MRKEVQFKKMTGESLRRYCYFPVKISLTILLGCFLQMSLYAQQIEVSGSVTDPSGMTLPGVNILVKGTTMGTVTNAEGRFSILASAKDILVVTFVGYEKQEVIVGNRQTVSIVLKEDVSLLEEIVVIGYGTQKKRLVTGATSQVKGEELSKRNVTNALQSLQGLTAGVSITSTSGQPGEELKVNIRGLGTTGKATPLYIVDGFQTGDISFLNPSDIESIDVLKDAASAAIYGNRGANGVILITTKSGKKSQLTNYSEVTFDAYNGWQSRAKKIRMLSTDEYVMIMNEQHLNSGGSTGNLPFNTNNLPSYTTAGVASTNWLDEMFVDNALTQNYVIGVSGGSQNSSYSMSLSSTGQEGIVGGSDLSDYNRYTGRFNSEHQLFDGILTWGENITFANVKNRGIAVGNQYSNSLRSAFNVSPLMPVYNDFNDFFNAADPTILDQNGKKYWFDQEANPYGSMYYNNQNSRNSQKLLGNIFAEIRLHKNLKFRSAFGIDYWASEYRSYSPVYKLSVYAFSDFSKAAQRLEKGLGINMDNLLTYNQDFGKHHFTAMAGMSLQRYNGSWMFGENTNIAFDDLGHAWLNNATNTDNATMMTIQGAPTEDSRLLSYFGRVQYNFSETYLFNATFRADGSSKFAPGNRWGYFPSLSAGWVITNEDFMERIKGVMPYFKLRASWGQNGSNNASAFNYLAPISFINATYNFGNEEGINTTGSYPSRLSNEKLKWETSEQLDIGFDAGFLDNRFMVNFDFYQKITKDWLIVAPVLATSGTDAPYINGGNVHNTGVELSLGYVNNNREFKYQLNLVGAYNKNKVTDVPTEDGIIHGATNTLYANSSEFYRAETGHAIGYFWGWETDGIFQTTDEVKAYVDANGKLIQPNAKPGDLRYVDQNGDGRIDDLDKTDLGDPNPDFIFGVNFAASWKGFDFNLVTSGVAGNQIVQATRNHVDKFSNYSTEILERWTGQGTSNSVPRVTNANINYRFSDIFVQSGAYFRISNITLGYNLATIIKMKSFKSLRLYASVQNLYTFTNYTGMDPEVGYGLDNGISDQFSSGIDLGYYPRPRIILFGVSVKL
jgi:TonB-dependent starch-binding outer membrane protein SusC